MTDMSADPFKATMTGYDIIEDALRSVGLVREVNHPVYGECTQAYAMSRALVARLAQHDPPILLAFDHEIKEEESS